METLVQAVQAKTFSRRKLYLPREHGATAMLLSPIFAPPSWLGPGIGANLRFLWRHSPLCPQKILLCC